MRTSTLPVLCAALLAAAPAAQQSFTSPRGYLDVEGDSSHFALFNSGIERFMQIDATLAGVPSAGIRAMAFRRDGERRSATGGARDLDLTVRLGHADYSAIGSTFAANWKGAPTTVFTTKRIRMPNWSQLAGAPAPFDLVVPFDVQWSYGGQDALAFELIVENVSVAGGPDVDRQLGSPDPFRQGFGFGIGFGCLIPNQSAELTHSLILRNYGPNHATYGMRIGTELWFGPANQVAVWNIGVTDPDLSVPGLCARIHAAPLVSQPLGTTNALGEVAQVFLDVPYDPLLEGVTLYTQIATLWPQAGGLPIALSDGRAATMPLQPRFAPQAAYLYATSKQDPAATLWRDRAVVVRFDR